MGNNLVHSSVTGRYAQGYRVHLEVNTLNQNIPENYSKQEYFLAIIILQEYCFSGKSETCTVLCILLHDSC